MPGFYRYAKEKGLLGHSPAVHVSGPRRDYESHPTASDPNEVGALPVAAGLGFRQDHALVSPLALNGLRVSEAIAPTSTGLAWARHCTLRIIGERAKIVMLSFAPRRAPPIDLATGGRLEGASSPTRIASNWFVTPPGGSCGALPGEPASASRSAGYTPPRVITAGLDPGVPLRMSKGGLADRSANDQAI